MTIPSHLPQFDRRAALQNSSAFLLPAIAKRDCTEEIQASLCKTQHQQMINRAVAAHCIWASAGPGHTPQGTLVSEHHTVGTRPRDRLVGSCKACFYRSAGLASPCFFPSPPLPRNGFWWFISCLSSFLWEEEFVAIQLALLCTGKHVKSCHGSRIY